MTPFIPFCWHPAILQTIEVSPLKLVTYHTDSGFCLGLIDDERGVLDVSKAAKTFHVEQILTPEQIYSNWDNTEPVLTELLIEASASQDKSLFLDIDSLNFAPIVPRPGKVICIGLNYRRHALESNLPLPEVPLLFSKYQNSIAAHEEIITLPNSATECDYEAELAIVISKRAKCVTEESARSYVLGYTTANDLSARDLQFRTSQWLLGKTCDGFCPIGPYLVTKDEIPNPDNLSIRCSVNGEERQNSNTSDLIFSCNEIISFVSHHLTLEAGDIILTGTPEGVAMGYPKGQEPWLEHGDTVVVEIEKIGRLVNQMRRG